MDAAVGPGRLSVSNGAHAASQHGSMQLGSRNKGGKLSQLDVQQQQQYVLSSSQQAHHAVLGQQQAYEQQMQHSNAAGHDQGESHMLPSADFALFAQLHLHNPIPAMRQLQRQQTPPHPVFESFPSFTGNEYRLQQELLQRAAADAAAAIESEAAVECSAPAQQADTAAAAHAGDLHVTQRGAAAVPSNKSPQVVASSSSDVSPASSSDAAVVISGSGSPQPQGQHGPHSRKVSLLSQQIACARSTAAAGAGDYGDGLQPQEVGSTHHHASEFWQYMQAQRAKNTADCDAALASNSSSCQPSRQQLQWQQQQLQQQPQQQMIVQVEEASPVRKGWTRASRQQHRQQVQQRLQQPHQHPRHLCWQETGPQQQHVQQRLEMQEQQETVRHQPQQRHDQLPPLPPRLALAPVGKNTSQQQQIGQTYLQDQPQQQQENGPEACHSQDISRPAAAVAAAPLNALKTNTSASSGLADIAAKPADAAHGAASAAATRCRSSDTGSVHSPGLLDGGAGSQGAVGWSHHYISGCTGAAPLPVGWDAQQGDARQASFPSSSQQQATLQSQASLGAQPLLVHGQPSGTDLAGLLEQQEQQREYGGADALALPGWGLPGLSFSSAYAPAWQHQDGMSGVASYGLDQLPGDASQLTEVMLAAAVLGTPPVPPKGSRFDDMDSFSSSLTSAAVAGSLAAASRQTKHQDVRQRRPVLLSRGGVVVARNRSSISDRSSSALLAPRVSFRDLTPGSQADSSAAAAVVSEHLDGLLSGLSLLGERAASEVGQELAVAHSVHQVMYHHHARYMHTGSAIESQETRSSSSRAASRTGSSDSLKRMLGRTSTPLALTLQDIGLQHLSSWLSSSAGWIARSTAAAFKQMVASSSGGSARGGAVQRSSSTVHQAASGGGGQVTGSLWQYNRAVAGGRSSFTRATRNGAGARQDGAVAAGESERRSSMGGGTLFGVQQPPVALGKAVRRWR